jgi:hypothetical protein
MGFFPDDPSDHPEALEIEMAGRTFGFLLNKSAFETAKSEGIDLERFDDMDEEDVVDNLSALSTLLYIGSRPFSAYGHETPESVEAIEDVLTPAGATELAAPVMSQFGGLDDEEISELSQGK